MGTKVTVSAQSLRDAAKIRFDDGKNGLILRAFMLLMLDELNTLRAQHSLPARTKTQLRNAIISKIDSGAAD